MVDVTKDIKEYKKEWYQKVEEDSKNLFELAAEVTAMDSKMNVIIVKRLPRFDRASQDILGIKSQLSKFANHVYDQLWLKQGSPDRIKVIELELECGKYRNLKNITFGTRNNPKYDGIHLVGDAASRQFTYRAVQKIAEIITKPFQPKSQRTFRKVAGAGGRASFPAKSARLPKNVGDAGHTDCPQARYQRQSATRSYSDDVKTPTYNVKTPTYNIPTKNYYESLNW